MPIPFRGASRIRVSIGSALLVLVLASVLGVSASLAPGDEAPTFRKGMWEFEKTLLINGKEITKKVSQCTDPTNEINGTLTPMNLGNCKSSPAQRRGNQYKISTNCGPGNDSHIVINVESDSKYTEVNEGALGKTTSKETTIARRVGDCKK